MASGSATGYFFPAVNKISAFFAKIYLNISFVILNSSTTKQYSDLKLVFRYQFGLLEALTEKQKFGSKFGISTGNFTTVHEIHMGIGVVLTTKH